MSLDMTGKLHSVRVRVRVVNSQQYLCLNKNCIRTIPVNMSVWMREFCKAPTLHFFFSYKFLLACFGIQWSGSQPSREMIWTDRCSHPPWVCRTLLDCCSAVLPLNIPCSLWTSHFHWLKQSLMLWKVDHLWVMFIYKPLCDIKWYYKR